MTMSISLAPAIVVAYDRHVSNETRIHDCEDDTVCTVRLFGPFEDVWATIETVDDLGRSSTVLALDGEGADALVRALGYDVDEIEAPTWTPPVIRWESSDAMQAKDAEIERLRGEVARLSRVARELADTRLALTSETCDRLANACRSGRGEQSISRHHAMARAALQSAADWLRRAEQGR